MACAFEIVRGIHWAEDVVGGDLAIKSVREAFESGVADGGVNVLFFH
jgi:hypothetical protein